MRNSILGFNQEQLIGYNTDMNEVLLLDYIYHAVASPTMEHIFENGICYVWLNHSRILEDLPILDIGEDRLKRVLKHLVDVGLLNTVRHNNTNLRGSKSYYTITEKCEELRYAHNDQVLKTTRGQVGPGVENNTSYIKLKNDNKTIPKGIVQNFEFSHKSTKPKESMYSKCVNLIDDFTTDLKLRNDLTEFLKRCIENSKESGTPFYTNNFVGKLNSLKKLSTDTKLQKQIVAETLENGWNGFHITKGTENATTRLEKLDKTDRISEEQRLAYKKQLKDLKEGNIDGQKF